MSETRRIARLALAAAALALCIAVLLVAPGCSKGDSPVSWSGGIVCADGVCTPTLTLTPAAPAARAQLEK